MNEEEKDEGEEGEEGEEDGEEEVVEGLVNLSMLFVCLKSASS